MLTIKNIWTIEPPRFGAFNLQQICAETVERFNRLTAEERRTVEIRACTNGGVGFAIADKLCATGLPATDFYQAALSRVSSAQTR